MHTLIVTDIFGRTTDLEALASKLLGSTDIVDPYNSKNMEFEDESQAYAYFTSRVGIDQYVRILKERVTGIPETIKVIGFSIGASAIWNMSADKTLTNISSAVGFYGSQIRKQAHIHPSFPIDLIFPVSEEHFCVTELITQLTGRKNVTVQQVEFLHGFMNPHSTYYNHEGCQQFISLLRGER